MKESAPETPSVEKGIRLKRLFETYLFGFCSLQDFIESYQSASDSDAEAVEQTFRYVTDEKVQEFFSALWKTERGAKYLGEMPILPEKLEFFHVLKFLKLSMQTINYIDAKRLMDDKEKLNVFLENYKRWDKRMPSTHLVHVDGLTKKPKL